MIVSLSLFVVYVIVHVYYYLFIARLTVDYIKIFAFDWYPRRYVAVALELLFTATDFLLLPVRRRLPLLRIGPVNLDFSIFLVVFLLAIIKNVTFGFLIGSS